MPVINAVIMPILPDNGEGVRADGYHVADARGRRISQLDIERLCVRFGFHVLMSAATRSAWTGSAQQLKGIDARMIVAPRDREFSGLLIGSNAGWFFVHQ